MIVDRLFALLLAVGVSGLALLSCLLSTVLLLGNPLLPSFFQIAFGILIALVSVIEAVIVLGCLLFAASPRLFDKLSNLAGR